MKNRALQILAMSSLLQVAFGCQRMPDAQESLVSQYRAGDELTFTATMEGGMDTRTVLDGTSIKWNPSESINIFYGASESGSRFVSTNTEPELSASFSGTISAFTATTETGQALSFWAVYPYNGSDSCSGSSVSSTLASEQVGVSGNIPDNTMMMVAESPGLALSFKQVCSRLRLRISHPDICRIVFSGNAGEVVAGGAVIAMDGSGNPVWTPIEGEGATEIELLPDGTHFEEGSEYYLVLYPQNFVDGVTIKYYRDELYGEHNFDEALEFRRAGRNTFNSNEVAEWTARTTQLPNEIWYTSTDGNPVDYAVTAATGNEIVSNTYANGQGIIRFASDVTVIDENAFKSQTTLASVTLPENVDKISRNAFYGCSGLREVNMGDNVRIIAEFAFGQCGFSQIHLSENLRAIGVSAFAYDSFLEEVHIPDLVTSLGYVGTSPYYFYDNPFMGCVSLRRFTGKFATEDGLCLLYGNGAGLKDALVSVALGAISGTFRVPDGVTYIVSSAFEVAPITGVDLNEVSAIDDYAFLGSKLQSVTIPSTVRYINNYAFADCRDMTEMWFESDELPRVLQGAFGGLSNDTGTRFVIHIPGMATITSGDMLLNATYDIESGGQTYTLTSYWYNYMQTDRIDVYQPDDEIWYHTSGEATLLPFSTANFGPTSLPVSQTGDGIFSMSDFPWFIACGAIPDEIDWIGIMKFNRPVMAIPANAFLAQETIDRISLPGSVVSIGEQAFQNCFALLSMELPNVRHLDASAFQNCSNLTTITIGGGIDAIPQNAFAGCINLESVIIPTSVINMVKQIGVDAFYQCHKLKVIAPNTSNDIVLLQGVTYVGLEAFFGAHSLTNVQMMNATYLGASAFGDCINLSTVNFKKAENVQASCFYGDESLTQVSLPKAWFVSSNVFRDCTSLETVSLASVQQVGDYAFANTSSLQTVKFGPDLASLGNYIFYYDLSTSTNNYQIDGYFAGGVPAITDKTFVQNDNPAFHDFEFQTIYIKEEYRDDFANAWQNAYGSYGYWNGDSF